jgi:hypothetical protein
VPQVRAPGRVRLWRILVESAWAWRRDFWYISLLAAIVEAPIVLVEVGIAIVRGEFPRADEGLTISLASAAVALSSMFAHYFLAAVMEVVESAERRGHRRPRVVDLVRELPWRRLIVADLILRLATVGGLVLLIVPGVAIATFTIITLPLLNMERQPILPTIRRSADLVRDHVPTALGVLFFVTVVDLVLGEAMGELFERATDSHVGEYLGHLATEVIMLPMAALPIVMLAFDLVDDRVERTGRRPN